MSDSDSTPSVEFFAAPKPSPEPSPEPEPVESVENEAMAAEEQALQKAVIPTLEVEVPDAKKLVEASRAELQMAKRATADPDDPAVLLQSLFGDLPGINAGRAADMALNADTALHNLGVEARRQEKLARRKERQQAAEEGRTTRRRR